MDMSNTTENHSQFTGFEYILIDIATHWGLDKETFPVRLKWAYENMDKFGKLALERGDWKESSLYTKGVLALTEVQQGLPTGHMIGMDAVNSGMQVLSAITGCKSGARATGMVDPTVRADAYSMCTELMNKKLGVVQAISRSDIKQACMTMLYGSRAVPEKLFGDDTPELEAFYTSMKEMAPGACKALAWLTQAWQPMALEHKWSLPDSPTAQVPVMQSVDTQIEIDELAHAKISMKYEVNEGSKKGISLIANVTHSIDAYVLRTLIRRCNYDQHRIESARDRLEMLLLEKNMKVPPWESDVKPNINLGKKIRFDHHGIVDLTDLDLILNNLNAAYYQLDELYLGKLIGILNDMLTSPPFPVVCIHDEMKCSPCHMGQLRFHYKNILADLADSTIFHDIYQQITGTRCSFRKLSNDLGDVIRQSNYALC